MFDTCLHLLRLTALVATTATAGDSVRADSLHRAVRTLPVIEVAGERARLDARRRMPTASVTDIRMGEANRAHESVVDVLQTATSARVVSYGGLGAFSTLSLRGAPPGQVSVYLDGLPLTSAAQSVVDLSDLPAAALERVEIYRGSAPLAFGPATPGGAVNLVSGGTPGVSTLHLARGAFGTWEGRAGGGLERGRLAVLAHAGVESSRGDFGYWNDNGTAFNLADDHAAVRANNRYDDADALVRAVWTPLRGPRATLRAEGFRKAQGVPGLGAVPAPNPRWTLARGLGALTLERAPGARTPGWTVRGWAREERTHFRDPEGELHLGRQDGTSWFDDRALTTMLASPADWSWITADASAGTRVETAAPTPPSLGQTSPPASQRTTHGAHVGIAAHVAGERLVVHAARRWDRQRESLRATLTGNVPWSANNGRTLDSPQLGARLRLPLGTSARAGWSKATRAPELSELFGDQAIVGASPKLLPERGENWDAALGWSGGGTGWNASFEWTRFQSHERDLIVWVPAASRTVRATNVSRAEIDGDEWALRASWRAFSCAGTATNLRALQTDASSIYFGRTLPQRPAHQASATARVQLGRWRAAGDLVVLGADYLDPINFQRVPQRTITSASLSVETGPLRWTLEGRNLGDVRVLDVAGYPLPGRSVFAACDARFGPGARP